MSQYTIEMRALPSDWQPPKRQERRVARQYLIPDEAANLLDQISLVTGVSKTDIITIAITSMGIVCKATPQIAIVLKTDPNQLSSMIRSKFGI